MGIGITGANVGYSRAAADARFAKASSPTQTITAETISASEYTVTNTNGDISTTKSVTTWEFGTKTFSVNTQATTPRGIDFNNTGTRVFVLNSTTGAIGVYQYDLSPSSPWDITTAVYNSVSKSITGVPVGIKFSTDGLYMFISNDTGDTVVRYTLVTPWDLNTVSVNPDQTYTLTNATNGVSTLRIPRGIDFSPDGTRMYVTDDDQNSVYQFNLVTPWSVNTAVYSGNSIFFNASPVNESSPQHAVISSDGTRLIITGAASDRIWEYTLPTPYSLAGAFLHGPMRRDLISVSFINLPIAAFPESNITGIYYNDVLNKCFYIGADTRRIQEIDVTPQMLITGTRPVIQGISTGGGFGSEMVRMNGLYITGLPAGTLSNGGGGLVVNGQIGCGGLSAVNFGINGGSFNVNSADGTVGWNGRSSFRSPATGSISMGAQSGNFRILRWGIGVDSSTPAIRRAETGVGLQVTTGTDTFSDFADLTAKNITATGTLSGLNFVAGGAALSTSGDFSLALSHLGRVIRYNDAPAIIVTVPDQSTVAWPDGSLIYLRRNTGAGTITIQGSGATIINDNASASILGGNMMAIRRVTTNEWDFI
jgi:DNA-binding beta-propeller fold protein YncE